VPGALEGWAQHDKGHQYRLILCLDDVAWSYRLPVRPGLQRKRRRAGQLPLSQTEAELGVAYWRGMSSIFEQSINRIALRVPRRSFATGLISLACRDEATTHANKRQISPVRANEDRNNYRSL